MNTDRPSPRRPQLRFLDPEKLRKERRRAKVTQKALGEAAGIGEARMSHFEAGREGCGADTIALFAVALGIPPERLMHKQGIDRYKVLTRAFAGNAAA